MASSNRTSAVAAALGAGSLPNEQLLTLLPLSLDLSPSSEAGRPAATVPLMRCSEQHKRCQKSSDNEGLVTFQELDLLCHDRCCFSFSAANQTR